MQKAITIQEFANALSLSTASVRRMIQKGQLNSIKVPGLTSVRIPVSEVDRLLGEQEQEGPSAATGDPETIGVHSSSATEVTPW
jgi:excisionase family DNA binding protein